MSAHAYTEDLLIERPATDLFRSLGWATASALQEIFGANGTLERETSAEVVLLARLRAALTKLNPQLPAGAIAAAVDQLARDRSAMLPAAANREIYTLLKEGVQVSVPDPERGGQKSERVRVIDWDDPQTNDFLLVSQMTITGPLYTCRPDLIGFVNGLPLILIEFKKPGVSARAAFDENITSYKHPQNGVPALFRYNALIIASNGTESRVGSLTADWERMAEWKRVEREDEPRRVSLEVMLRGVCEPTRLLDLVENFTLFSEHKAGLVKILGQNHQVLGVNAAIRSLLAVRHSTKPTTLTPTPLPKVEGHYRGGFRFSGLVERARELRQLQTPAEEMAWELLRDRQLNGWKFRRQHQIGDYITDFFCAEQMLVVEVDGDVHTSSAVATKDAQRDAYLRSLGYTILRFRNDFVVNQPAAFLEQIASIKAVPSTSGRGVGGEGNTPNPNGIGVFWQTQGSGKSFSMVFFSQKVLRKITGNWTFVVVTDRKELDDQIAKTFKATGAVTQHEGDECHAQSGSELRDLLRGNHRFVFTLIHKFQEPEPLSDRRDIIVLTDEAHRSQYDTLALNMRASLPNAMFLAFTGTPLISGEERTREVFGDYVSIYDFQQSVEDGATVPLFYENRTPELRLKNPNLNEDIYELIEAAELDEEAEKKLERELGRQYQIITRDDRLEKVAKDIVHHFLGRGFQGKAMVVSIDKATALKMHDKVRKHWASEKTRVESELADLTKFTASDPDRVGELNDRLARLNYVDMALIVSAAQNEVEQMAKLGLDIVPHRQRMNAEKLDEDFKDPDDPLSLVFVCAMWLTGFDAPSCSTIYLDKPMRNHTLMQTIARANRVYPGKHSGLIVDYANVFASLEKALAIYGAAKGGATPVRDKAELVKELGKAVEAAIAFCADHGVEIGQTESAAGLDKVRLIGDAVNALISPDPLRKEFLAHERLVRTLFQAIKPDPAVLEFVSRVHCLGIIADEIRLRTSGSQPANISAVMAKVNELLDESIAADGFNIRPTEDGRGIIDLAKIDFEKLAKRFKQSKKKNIDLEQLKAAIRAQLDKLIRLNKTRADYLTKFEELIESYNSGSRTIQELFEELLVFSRSLNEEQQRHVREQLSEAELTVFDLLTRPGPDLSDEEREEVKKVARQLLKRVKQGLGVNWRQKAQARAQVRLAIEDELDEGLPRVYSPELYQQKCSAVFEHVFESFSHDEQVA